MDNTTDFVPAIPNIRLFDVCHYIVSLGIIFRQKGLIKNEEQNQTVQVFNTFFQHLQESNATEAKVLLLLEMSNKNYSDKAFDMKYVNETYEYIINEGLFAYYGNMTGYLSIRNFPRKTNFTVLKKIVSDDLSTNYVNNVSCSRENVSSKLGISLSPVAIDHLFADHLWPVFKRTEKNFRRTGNNLENVEKRELQINRHRKRQVSDNDDSNLDIYFPNFSNEEKEELLKAADDYSLSAVTEANQFWTINDAIMQPHAIFSTDETKESVLENDDSNFDFLNPLEGEAADVAIEDLWPTFAESNLNIGPFVDTDSSSHSKIRRIDTSTKLSGSENEISHNENEFGNRARNFQNMANVYNNHVPENPSFQIDIDDLPGTSNQSVVSQLAQFLKAREIRKKLEESTYSSGNDLANVQEGNTQEDELVEKRFVYVQIDYAGRRERVPFILRKMKIDTKSKRMQSIANAAIITSSNASNNCTFEDSLKMLKGYILKLKGGSSLVPTYNKLAIDFCANNLNVPEEYNEWKIPNHRLIDDVLFETNFYVPMTKTQLVQKSNIFRNFPPQETLKSIIDIYENSSLLQESLNFQDFVIIRRKFHDIKFDNDILEKRVIVALYRLALRECEEEWIERHIKLYSVAYSAQLNYHNKKSFIGSNYTFDMLKKFSLDKILEESKLHNKEWRKFLNLNVELDNSAGIASIDRIFNKNDGFYIILINSLKVMNKTFENINGSVVCSLKLKDKRSKEEKMIDIIKRLYGLLYAFPDQFKHYN